MDTYATQEDIQNYLATNGFIVEDTIIADAALEPTTAAGYMQPYVAVRHNDPTKLPNGGSFGGARHDELYMLTDCLVVAADMDEAREVAWAEGGVSDVLTGYIPVGAGEMTKAGGNVFTINDGTNTRPTRYVARLSFRCQVNMVIDE